MILSFLKIISIMSGFCESGTGFSARINKLFVLLQFILMVLNMQKRPSFSFQNSIMPTQIKFY